MARKTKSKVLDKVRKLETLCVLVGIIMAGDIRTTEELRVVV